ncbi:iron transporter [Chloroflexota bacterium]
MPNFQAQLKIGFLAGLKKGGSSFVWMCKIIIPVSFLVTLLQWTGWLNQLDFLLNPFTSLINLPSEAALPIITGMLINIYAVIAVITVLPFTIAQMTLIAIFNLIAHSLIMEGIIQHKSGINVIKATLVRVTAAFLTVLIVSQFLGDTSQSVIVSADLAVQPPLLEILKGWVVNMIGLLMKILVIIMSIMIMLESLRALGWIEYSFKYFWPLLRILGLSGRTSMMLVAAILFGLFYGGAVIIEEAKNRTLTKEELEHLHISIGINHAMVEDPALFAVLGLNVFWLLVPRFITAIIAVHTYRAIKYLKRKLLRY